MYKDKNMTYSTKARQRFYSGQICPKTATYGQYSDRTNEYAGASYDRKVDCGERFPPSLNNHYFAQK